MLKVEVSICMYVSNYVPILIFFPLRLKKLFNPITDLKLAQIPEIPLYVY